MLQTTQLRWISKVAYHLLELVVVVLIIVLVIELSGVQFGLKPYVRFKNRTSEEREFDLKSVISDQNYTPLISITTLLHPFRNIHLGIKVAKFATQWLSLPSTFRQFYWSLEI